MSIEFKENLIVEGVDVVESISNSSTPDKVETLTNKTINSDANTLLATNKTNDDAEEEIQAILDMVAIRTIESEGKSGFIHRDIDSMGELEFYDGVHKIEIDKNGVTTKTADTSNVGKLTITPVSGRSTFDFYILGKKVKKTTVTQTLAPSCDCVIAGYFNEDGIFTLQEAPTDSEMEFILDGPNALACIFYYNNTHDEWVTFQDERHGCEMSGVTHYKMHNTVGCDFAKGGTIAGLVSGSQTFTQIDSGRAWDEDILIKLIAQAELPHFYKAGTGWRLHSTNDELGLLEGPVEDRIAQYNKETAVDSGIYTLAPVEGNDAMICFIFMSRNAKNHYIGFIGQEVYTRVSKARDDVHNALKKLSLTGMPTPEYTPIGAFILDRDGKLKTLDDGSLYIDLRTIKGTGSAGESGGVSDHQNLVNRNEPNQHTQSSITGLSDTFNTKANTVHSHIIDDTTGLQSALDAKVDDSQVLTNVPGGAKFTDTVYTHPTSSGFKHLPSGGSVGQVIINTNTGVGTWQDLPNVGEEVSITRSIATKELADFSDSTNTLLTLPGQAIVEDIACEITEAFPQNTTLEIGFSTDTDYFITAFDSDAVHSYIADKTFFDKNASRMISKNEIDINITITDPDGPVFTTGTNIPNATSNAKVTGDYSGAVFVKTNQNYTSVSEVDSWNGSSFSAAASRNTPTALGITGGTPSDLYSVAGCTAPIQDPPVGASEHYDGSVWTAKDQITTGRCYSAADMETSSIIVVGGQVEGGATINAVESYEGTTWSTKTDVTTYSYKGGFCGDGDFGGIYVPRNSTSAELWNGATWSTASTTIASRSVVAICGTEDEAMLTGHGAGTAVEQWDGSTWSSLTNTVRDTEYQSMDGSPYNAFLAASGYWTEYMNRPTPTDVAIQGPSLTTGMKEIGGAGVLGSLIAFGRDTTYNPTLQEFDGTSWSRSSNFAENASTSGGGEDVAVAMAVVRSNSNAYTFNGTSWTSEANPSISRNDNRFDYSLDSGVIFGGNTDGSKVETFNGSTWSIVGDLNTDRFHGWCCGDGDHALFFGGWEGSASNAFESWDGSIITTQTNLPTASNYCQGGGDLFSAYFTTNNNATYKFDGTSWSVGTNFASPIAGYGASQVSAGTYLCIAGANSEVKNYQYLKKSNKIGKATFYLTYF